MLVASSQQFSRSRRPEPVVITEAAPSLGDQQAARKRRYAITMAVRGLALVLAAVFYQTVWLMIILAILGTVLPWIAVVMANDRPPKPRTRLAGVDARPDRVLENPARSGRVIEG
ncbi:DUF3099 domain-containing protein [Blastococcus xanthinilyticus]|uniref:DUF3099 family protein n=1 Tax=Blastococcus xanthinilyticus TaxID=1564164 RepID=A0A5S5D4R2_9ACTN|nr:DUF3099 domain-containing protein [Blastococcus xanthinilyticus]TYP90665.1 Protein of unknown function (DUF3099) [Blastococcus xanthinilyticus]